LGVAGVFVWWFRQAGVPLIPSADVNDPVSGTGNPALIGNAGECDADDENQCATKKEDGQ
jgi:hypothetical protein